MTRSCRPLVLFLIALTLLWTQATYSYASLSSMSPKLDAFGNPLCLTSQNEDRHQPGVVCCFACCFSSYLGIVGSPDDNYDLLRRNYTFEPPIAPIFGIRPTAKHYPGFPRAPPFP